MYSYNERETRCLRQQAKIAPMRRSTARKHRVEQLEINLRGLSGINSLAIQIPAAVLFKCARRNTDWWAFMTVEEEIDRQGEKKRRGAGHHHPPVYSKSFLPRRKHFATGNKHLTAAGSRWGHLGPHWYKGKKSPGIPQRVIPSRCLTDFPVQNF